MGRYFNYSDNINKDVMHYYTDEVHIKCINVKTVFIYPLPVVRLLQFLVSYNC